MATEHVLRCEICGSTGPDVLWADNFDLCGACDPARAGAREPASNARAAGAGGDDAIDDVAAEATRNGGPPPGNKPVVISTVRSYLARERAPIEPLVATPDSRTTVLGVETALLLAGPSGHGKTLAAFDLCGKLAGDHGGEWLGLRVKGGQRVLVLPFEGSDEDNAERLEQLTPDDAGERLLVWDRWAGADLPRAEDPAAIAALVDVIREHAIDALTIDTGSAFFGRGFGVDRGEEAALVVGDLRARSRSRFALIVVAHTKKADRGGARVDDLEEISGLYGRKVDAAIVIRRNGSQSDTPMRQIAFAKVRRGPTPRPKLASFPAEDSDDPPRLTLVGDLGRPVKHGSEADAMADWISGHDQPVAATVICARFEISDSTLAQRRRLALEERGVTRAKLPGRGKTHGYGTAQQWKDALGMEQLG